VENDEGLYALIATAVLTLMKLTKYFFGKKNKKAQEDSDNG
jgi:hypothetical protein